MMAEPTPEMIAMARRVINENSDYMRGLDGGQRFFSAEEVLRIALAAIQTTTEKAAKLAADTIDEARLGEIDNDLRCIKHVMVSRLANSAHLKEQSNAE